MREDIEQLANLIKNSDRIVFFGGAGVSTASGIPDFRSGDGLYSEKYHNLPPESIISHDFFVKDTKTFYDYYREHLIFENAKPNKAHFVLADLERQGKMLGVITQNIDGLHQLAGSQKVYELHGTVHSNRCTKCGKLYNLKKITKTEGIPYCECGGIIKPEVVLYGENLPDHTVNKAIECLRESDLLIIAGTSLVVYPAAAFVHYFRGKNIVLINLSSTYVDNIATLVIHERVEYVLGEVEKILKGVDKD